METASAAPATPTARPRGFFARLWKALRQVFHETVAVVFLLLALSWIASALRLWQHGAERWLWMVSGCFALLLMFFGFTSYQSSRRVR